MNNEDIELNNNNLIKLFITITSDFEILKKQKQKPFSSLTSNQLTIINNIFNSSKLVKYLETKSENKKIGYSNINNKNSSLTRMNMKLNKTYFNQNQLGNFKLFYNTTFENILIGRNILNTLKSNIIKDFISIVNYQVIDKSKTKTQIQIDTRSIQNKSNMMEEGRKVNIRSQSKYIDSNSESIIKKRQINKRLKEISIDSNFLLMKDLNINNMYIDNEISTRAYEMFVSRKNKELSQIIDLSNKKSVNKDNKNNKKMSSVEIISYQKLFSLHKHKKDISKVKAIIFN